MDIYEELRRLLGKLNSIGIPYAVCGGFAVAFHGYTRATKDIDLLVDPNDLEPMITAAKDCGFDESDGFLVFDVGTPKETRIKRLNKFVDNEFLTLDLILVNAQTRTAWETRIRSKLPDQEIQMVSQSGLAQMKRLAGRPQDLVDLEKLGLKDA